MACQGDLQEVIAIRGAPWAPSWPTVDELNACEMARGTPSRRGAIAARALAEQIGSAVQAAEVIDPLGGWRPQFRFACPEV